MKITRIRPWHVSGPAADATEVSPKLSYVFVQVETDEGLTGWGEITTYPGPVANRTIVAALHEVGEFLKGDDPTHIENIWHKLVRAYTYVVTRVASTAMVSGWARVRWRAVWRIAWRRTTSPGSKRRGRPRATTPSNRCGRRFRRASPSANACTRVLSFCRC